MPSKKTHGIHDLLFKEVYAHKKYCLDIFKLIFSPLEFKIFDWETLEPQLRMFVSEEGREKRADLIFSVKLKEKKEQSVQIIFLLEHKSSPSEKLCHQMLGYQAGVYSSCEYKHPILPILVYHGREKDWRAPLSFQDSLKNFNPTLKEHFGEDVLNFRCRELNINKIDLYGKIGKNLISRPILLIMGKIWNISPKIIEEMFKMGADLKKTEDQEFLISRAVAYISRYNPDFSFKVIREIEEKSMDKEHKVMSLMQDVLDEEREKGLQRGREEGIQTGIQKGRQEGIQKGIQTGIQKGHEETALRMIQNGLDLKTITLCTGLTLEKVEELQKKAQKV